MPHPWKTLEGLPRASWALAVATLVNRAGTMVIPFFAIYLKQKLGFSTAFVSALFALYGLGALVGGPVAGRLCDRIGALRVLAACLAASGLVLLVMPFAASETAVALSVLAFAITSEGVRPATMTVAGALVPPERKKSAFVLHRLAVNLGMSVGPAIGGFLAAVDYRLLFWIDGGTSLLGTALLLATVPGALTPARAPEAAVTKVGRASVFADRRFRRFLVGVIFVGLVFFQLEAAMPLFVVGKLNVPVQAFGFLFTLNTVMIIVLEVPINGAIERWSHARSLATGAILVGIGFGSLAFATGIGVAALATVLITFGEMVLFPALSSFVSDISPEGRNGEYMGTFSMAFAFAYAIGPALGTFTLEAAGPLVLWPATLVVALVAAGLFTAVAEASPAPAK